MDEEKEAAPTAMEAQAPPEAPPAPDAPAAPEKPGFGALARRAIAAFLDWFWSNVAVGTFGVWLLAEVFRDRLRITGVFLLIPSLSIAAMLLATALLARVCTCRKIALAALVLSLFPAVSGLFVENQWVRPKPQGDAEHRLRLVHWNVGENASGWKATLERLEAQKPDVCVLSEICSRADVGSIAAGLGSDFRVYHVRNLAVVARGPVGLVMPDERVSSRAYFVDWQSAHGTVRLLVCDIPSHPIYYHAGWLAKVRERVHKHLPDLVVGDFNATRRTSALSRLPEGYAHAYYAAGKGWSCTWPDPFPLWDIDQCIGGPRIRPIRYDIVATGVSDHRMQVFDFSLAPEGASPAPTGAR